MYSASGTASTEQSTVTNSATPTVRSVTVAEHLVGEHADDVVGR